MNMSRSDRGTMKPKRIASPWLKPSAAPLANVRFDLAVDGGQRLVGRKHHHHIGG